jgi:hypothetical protein
MKYRTLTTIRLNDPASSPILSLPVTVIPVLDVLPMPTLFATSVSLLMGVVMQEATKKLIVRMVFQAYISV